MNRRAILLCIPFTLVSASAFATGTNGATLPMKYEGGTLPLGQGKTRASISEDKLVFTQGHRKLAIPLEDITAISCNTDIRRRFGAPVLGVVPRLHLETAETYYVGLTWTGNSHEGQPPARIEGVFKLSGSEYADFLTILERRTGKKAIDTHRVPVVVRYGI
jgi:hypothetical protein